MNTKLLTVAAALLWSSSAGASTITIQLTGHVLPFIPGNALMGLDTTGVFGTPDSRLNGDAYTATIVYDPDAAPADAYPSDPTYGVYEREYYSGGPSFLNISVTINGHTETVTGLTNFQEAIISDSSTGNSASFFDSNHGHDSSTGAAFDESYADFLFNSIQGQSLLSSDALPTSVNLAAVPVGPDTKIGDLSILRGVYGTGPDGGNTITAEADSLYLGLDSITSWSETPNTSAVPEPATLPLVGIGVAGLVMKLRRKASHRKAQA